MKPEERIKQYFMMSKWKDYSWLYSSFQIILPVFLNARTGNKNKKLPSRVDTKNTKSFLSNL